MTGKPAYEDLERRIRLLEEESIRAKNAEKSLKESERRLYDIIQGSPIPAFVIGMDHRIIYWNKALEALSGIRAEKVMGTSEQWRAFYSQERPCLADLLVDQNLKAVPLLYSDKYKKTELIEDAYEVTDFFPALERGKWLRLTAAAIRDSQGDLVGAVETLEDVTDRKQAEEDLQQSKHRLNDIIDFLPDATLAIDREKKVIVWNKAIEKMTGIRAEDMIGKGNYEYTIPFYGDRRPQLMDLIWEDDQSIVEKYPHVNREGDSVSVETFCGALYDGLGAHVFAKASPLHDRKGNVIGAIESIRDISGSKKMQQLIDAKNKELEQMLSIASHDLRSPLVNVVGYSRELESVAEALSHDFDADNASVDTMKTAARSRLQEMTAALQYIRNSTMQMDALLKGLLRLSRAGRAALTIVPLDMNELIAGVVASTEFMIKEAGVVLQIAELPPCRGDAVQVTQVFSNLLGNALKYLDPKRPGIVRISGSVKEGRSLYCVEDNGIGIAPAHQDRIFDVFHRLEPSRNEGEGLGLTIVRQVLGRLAGEIRVESKPGEGSRFFVTLPSASARDR